MVLKKTIWPIAALIILASAVSANPWADAVVTYKIGYPAQFASDARFNNPSRALGRPYGLVETVPDNSSQVSLGDLVRTANPSGSDVSGGYITLMFNDKVYDDPKNPYGKDFIVFSNTCFTLGGITANSHYRWQEAAFVEISQDGNYWYLIKPNILPLDLNKNEVDTGHSYTTLRNYAEYTPTIGLPQDLQADELYPDFSETRSAEEYYTVPDRQSFDGDEDSFLVDRVSGGGDAMDIADAVLESQLHPGVPVLDGNGKCIPANITWFNNVRITDAYDGDSEGDFGEVSAEIDAVSDVRPSVTPCEAKHLNQGDYAVITDAHVTYSNYTETYDPDGDRMLYTGECFIQDNNRCAGLRLLYTNAHKPLLTGDVATVTGHLNKTTSRITLPDTIFTVTSSDKTLPAPLGMRLNSLDLSLAYGLRVRSWGKVTSDIMQDGDTYSCTISDGASSAILKWTDSGYTGPVKGSNIAITAVCDRDPSTNAVVLRVSDPTNDIETY